jgi:hypothetical protein
MKNPIAFVATGFPSNINLSRKFIGATLAHIRNPYMQTGGRPWVPTDYCVRRVECYVSRIAF